MSFPTAFYRWRPHPWHGLDTGPKVPSVVHAYIEITPFDLVKYEVDKETGYLRVDRPQRTSSQPPALYGFIPRTFCGRRVGELMPGAERGDGDPLDICVFSERPITRSEVILNAKVIGGLPMVDRGEADDKIIAVLLNDYLWSHVETIDDLPSVLVERLRHYFSTYKMVPERIHGSAGGTDGYAHGVSPESGITNDVSIAAAYGREHAHAVIAAAVADYEEEYGS